MSDINAQLPVRSEQDAHERVQIKIMDYADPTGTNKQAQVSDNALHVKTIGQQVGGGTETLLLSESGAAVIDGIYNATTNTDPSNIGIIGHARAASPANSDQTIRITSANPSSDNVAPANVHALDTNSFLMGFDGTNWDRITATSGALNVNVTNSLSIDINGVYDVGTNPTPDSAGAIFHVRAATPAITDQTFRSTGATPASDNVSPANVHALDVNSFGMIYDGTNWDRLLGFGGKAGVALFDEAGNAFTISNPLPVQMSNNPGTDVTDYKAAAAVAGGASDNHDYTVTGGQTLSMTRIIGSASGRAKMVVQVETGVATNVWTTYATLFNSTANPNMEWEVNPTLEVAAGVRVRVILTNRENQAMDLFSTIQGYEFT